MKRFLDDNFLLHSKTAEELYHGYAAGLPIIDYHNHLPPQQIAEDIRFQNLTQAWLGGDHYKWRAMRANGIDESYCTGNQSDADKFMAWAKTVPYTLRNPLHHWTHLELKRYFGIDELLNADSARRIYDACNEQLQSREFSVRNLLRRMNVEKVCTTDDPVDSLSYHEKMADAAVAAEDKAEPGREAGSDATGSLVMLPAFRPDQAMQFHDPGLFNAYARRLEEASGIAISNYEDYLIALGNRHDFFGSMDCVIADHGLDRMYAEEFTRKEITDAFDTLRSGKPVNRHQQDQLKSALMLSICGWHWEKGWVQQFHLGPIRNNNTRMKRELGPDTGFDSIGDQPQAASLAAFLDRLDQPDRLAKTILYNLNPSDNEVFATMAGNFNDGTSVGKVQWGSAWWFMDQKDGMERQLNTLSNMGLISRFVGMLTDSRSFLSFPRHEYFRRILCNLFGAEIERGEMPSDIPWTGGIIRDICYNNAKNYFNWSEAPQDARSAVK